MKTGFYLKLAASNLYKNRRLYIPHILTGCGLTAVFYIVLTLSMDDRLQEVRGGRYLPTLMPMGAFVMGLLSVILILYTNSFLMKQRKQEFGLYNILGMEKRHVGKILFFETAISSLSSIILGLFAGIVLYKLCALLICRILMVDSILGFYHVSAPTLVPAALFFAALYLVTYLLNRMQIARMKPIELLQSSRTGEREPKIKWLFLLIGLIALGFGYYIALTTQSPLEAIPLFFCAVLLVILGTYFLFIAGSIALLKLLKRNTHFYYQRRHMIAVSGLLYRMKQNAVGLASIAVLATGVLIMISTTVSLYAGIHDTLQRQHPHQLNFSANYDIGDDTENFVSIPSDVMTSFIEDAAEENELEIAYVQSQQYLSVAYLYQDKTFITDRDAYNDVSSLNELIECYFITAQEYEKLTGNPIDLRTNEVACFTSTFANRELDDTFRLAQTEFSKTITLDTYPISISSDVLANTYGIVVSDETVLQRIYEDQAEAYGSSASGICDSIVVDFADEEAAGQKIRTLEKIMEQNIMSYVDAQPDSTGALGWTWHSVWSTEEYLYGMYGTLLFLGLILAFVFLFATALIIYYKQISEGYEDRRNFQIMQKVGMASREVKSAIRSQILLVFFLPLLVAAVHVSVAFPILTKLLHIFFAPNDMLFLICTVATFGIFILIYVAIYTLTAKIYYQIVR